MQEISRRTIPDFATYEDAADFFDKTDSTTLDYDQVLYTRFPGTPARAKQRAARNVHVPLEIRRAIARRRGERRAGRHLA